MPDVPIVGDHAFNVLFLVCVVFMVVVFIGTCMVLYEWRRKRGNKSRFGPPQAKTKSGTYRF